jgi:hypothetical protein
LERVVRVQEEDEDLARVVQDYWNEKIDENESQRYSKLPQDIRNAIKFLKKTFKYHEFDKRDGSIVNKILLEDGSIEHRKEEVDKLLLGVMKKAQLKEDQPMYNEPIPFPTLPKLTYEECQEIIDKISHGKAIAFDGVSDCLFDNKNKAKTAKVFRDLWNSKWEECIENDEHFSTRLIPLNKVHPEIPTKEKFRPISVSSPIVKFLEAKLISKLTDYVVHKMHRGQTGFVPGQGITINQMRLIERVTERISSGRQTYGIFIDFSNAYNTILHTKLYERLEGILDKEEIQLIKAIYSRLKIKIGKESFTPNIGVAQGSIISPFLFNIYAEDLYKTLDKEGINPEDQMGYADDLFIVCYSKSNLRKVIQILKDWSIKNNLGLNAAKSGIMEFLPRTGKHTLTLNIGEEFEGIPVVACYKYLGMWVDQKLTMDIQLDHIKEKSRWISCMLWPVLRRVSLEYCKNLWTILIRPLFEQVTMLYYAERSQSNKEKVEVAIRETFRNFTLLKKNTKKEILHDLMQFDIEERAALNVIVAKRKWETRMGKQLYVKEVSPNTEEELRLKNSNKKKRILPGELRLLLNLTRAKCPKCKSDTMCSKQHMEDQHQIDIPTYEELIDMVEKKTEEAKSRKLSRGKTLDYIGSFIKIYIDRMTQFLDVQDA